MINQKVKETKMNQNKIHSQHKKLKITLDTSVPVKDERPIARLYELFQGFKQQYGPKGAVKK